MGSLAELIVRILIEHGRLSYARLATKVARELQFNRTDDVLYVFRAMVEARFVERAPGRGTPAADMPKREPKSGSGGGPRSGSKIFAEEHLQTFDDGPNPSEEILYDGGFKNYRNWFRATISMLTTMKFINLENLVKGVAIDPYDIEDWDEYFTQDDREFVYDVVTNTVTQVQLDIIERADRNGILLLIHYFRKWGSPNLPNSIKALSDVLTMKVGKHQDPSRPQEDRDHIPRVLR
ncbi:CCHC-type domain-containing protein [Pseudoscourfieldia marina]